MNIDIGACVVVLEMSAEHGDRREKARLKTRENKQFRPAICRSAHRRSFRLISFLMSQQQQSTDIGQYFRSFQVVLLVLEEMMPALSVTANTGSSPEWTMWDTWDSTVGWLHKFQTQAAKEVREPRADSSRTIPPFPSSLQSLSPGVVSTKGLNQEQMLDFARAFGRVSSYLTSVMATTEPLTEDWNRHERVLAMIIELRRQVDKISVARTTAPPRRQEAASSATPFVFPPMLKTTVPVTTTTTTPTTQSTSPPTFSFGPGSIYTIPTAATTTTTTTRIEAPWWDKE
jgi:hypothetical protein